MSESKIQAEIIKHARNVLKVPKGCLFSIPNEGKRSGQFASRLKAQGMVSGVPDLCLVWRGRVVFIEVKAPGGKLSTSQLNVIGNLKCEGADVRLVKSLGDFLAIFEE